MFPTLHDDVSDIQVQIKDIALRFDYANVPIETIRGSPLLFSPRYSSGQNTRDCPAAQLSVGMNAYSPLRKLAMAPAAFAYCITPSTGYAQMEVWHIGKGGLSWSSQAETQIGALDVDGALQPLELAEGESLIDLLRSSGQRFSTGSPWTIRRAGSHAPGPTMDSSTNSMAPSTW